MLNTYNALSQNVEGHTLLIIRYRMLLYCCIYTVVTIQLYQYHLRVFSRHSYARASVSLMSMVQHRLDQSPGWT